MRVTFDTNCFFDLFERNSVYVQELLQLQEAGLIDIAMTTRVMNDTLDKWKGEGISPIWTKIQTLPQVARIGSAFRLDSTRLRSEDFLISNADRVTLDRISRIMSSAQIEDHDHLFAHIADGRDLFITSDPHFLDHADQLREELAVFVLTPEMALERIRQK